MSGKVTNIDKSVLQLDSRKKFRCVNFEKLKVLKCSFSITVAVCWGGYLPGRGVSAQWGVCPRGCLPRGVSVRGSAGGSAGGCLPRGVCLPRGLCLPRGCPPRGVCLIGGVCPGRDVSQHALGQAPP